MADRRWPPSVIHITSLRDTICHWLRGLLPKECSQTSLDSAVCRCGRAKFWCGETGHPPLNQPLRDGFIQNLAHGQRDDGDVLAAEEAANLSDGVA